MDAEFWERARAVFGKAIAQPREQRGSVVDELCGKDEPLRREVMSLIDADHAAEGFLELKTELDYEDSEELVSEKPFAGRQVGPYRIDRILGRGGMGVVCLATRTDGEFRQQVALKLLRSGLVAQDVVSRFRTERQILANLDHPNIARLLDGGTTGDGMPFLAMEFIKGQPIDSFCDLHRLTVRERLLLFLQVCDAVQFAHQGLVVHRDLKPSNILVTISRHVKLLDFGISKLLEPRTEEESTVFARRLMTPEYASPEQSRGEAVTTATDVYSLGVLLYRLLSGHAPYDVDTSSAFSIARVISEQEPEPPSQVIMRPRTQTGGSDVKPEANIRESIAEARGTDISRLARKLRGDIDNIVLKALAKVPQRRYSSAQQLADDLERHLAGKPVRARPPTLLYLWHKFLRRHQLAVGAASLLLLSSLAFGTVMSFQSIRISRERDRAEHVKTFLVDLFEGADPETNGGREPTVREILDRGASRLDDSEVGNNLDDSIDLHETLGVIYKRLGRPDDAAIHLETALAQRLQKGSQENPETIRALNLMGAVLMDQGSYSRAESMLDRALVLATRVLGRNDPRTLKITNDIGVLQLSMGQYAEAEANLEITLGGRQRTQPDQLQQLAESHNNLATAMYYQGKNVDAEAHYQAAFDLYREVLGDQHPAVVRALANLAAIRLARGHAPEAEQAYREILSTQRAIYEQPHPAIALTLNNLGATKRLQLDHSASERFFREALDMRRELFGDRHPDVAESLIGLGASLRSLEHFRAAESTLAEALALQRRLLPSTHPVIGSTLFHLSSVELALEEFQACEATAREALGVLGQAFEPPNWQLSRIESVLGGCLANQGNYAEAEALLLAGLRVLLETRGEQAPETADTRFRLASLYQRWGKPELSLQYR